MDDMSLYSNRVVTALLRIRDVYPFDCGGVNRGVISGGSSLSSLNLGLDYREKSVWRRLLFEAEGHACSPRVLARCGHPLCLVLGPNPARGADPGRNPNLVSSVAPASCPCEYLCSRREASCMVRSIAAGSVCAFDSLPL